MLRLKLIFIALVLAVSLISSSPATADYCGENCLSCSPTQHGTEICCQWINGHFQGCSEI